MSSWQDGFEMARELRKDPQYKEMPILMMTGVKKETGIDFKPTAGDPVWNPVDGFLDKPVEPDTLIAEVERLLSEKKLNKTGIPRQLSLGSIPITAGVACFLQSEY